MYTTEDTRDVDFNQANLLMNLNVAYMVYDSGVVVQSGASQFDSWTVPMPYNQSAALAAGLALWLLLILV